MLLTGAHGQLGSVVCRVFHDWEVVAHTRETLDITSPTGVAEAVAVASPDVIVNCAAFNDVDAAEDRPEAALAVNAFAVRAMARAAEACGATLVHYGTDFVFDGTASEPYNEAAAPSPRSAYSASKLLGDWFALESPSAFVLRVESLFGMPPAWSHRLGTLDRLVRTLLSGGEVKAFTDRIVTPSYVEDVAAATRVLVERRATPGLYHCVNSGAATWHDIVTESARRLGIAAPRIQPVTTDEVAMRAWRPRYCALSNAKLREAGVVMPAWQDAVGRWLGTFTGS
jgi:dTDP-4-dehydrorhamnose reductase